MRTGALGGRMLDGHAYAPRIQLALLQKSYLRQLILLHRSIITIVAPAYVVGLDPTTMDHP